MASRTPVPTNSTSPQPAYIQRLQRQIARRRSLSMHVFIFAIIAVDLLVLNLLTNRDTIWAVWPIGVWAILLVAHFGVTLVKPAVFGLHLFGGGAICVGLFIINIFHGRDDANFGGWWVIWPILAWLLSLVMHLPFAFDLLAQVRSQGDRRTPPSRR